VGDKKVEVKIGDHVFEAVIPVRQNRLTKVKITQSGVLVSSPVDVDQVLK
jgi:hypothetical protein